MSDFKATILLATALFLMSAPEPDSRTIAEATAGFIVPADEISLRADEEAPPAESHVAPDPEPAVVAGPPQEPVRPEQG